MRRLIINQGLIKNMILINFKRKMSFMAMRRLIKEF